MYRRADNLLKGHRACVNSTGNSIRKAADRITTELDGGQILSRRTEQALERQQGAIETETFQEVAEVFLAAAKSRWDGRDGLTETFWRGTLKNYVYPVIGKLPVAAGREERHYGQSSADRARVILMIVVLTSTTDRLRNRSPRRPRATNPSSVE